MVILSFSSFFFSASRFPFRLHPLTFSPRSKSSKFLHVRRGKHYDLNPDFWPSLAIKIRETRSTALHEPLACLLIISPMWADEGVRAWRGCVFGSYFGANFAHQLVRHVAGTEERLFNSGMQMICFTNERVIFKVTQINASLVARVLKLSPSNVSSVFMNCQA